MATGWGQNAFTTAAQAAIQSWSTFWVHLYQAGPAPTSPAHTAGLYTESNWPGYSYWAAGGPPTPAYDYTTPYGVWQWPAHTWTVGAITGSQPITHWAVFDSAGDLIVIEDLSPNIVVSVPGQIISLTLQLLVLGQSPAMRAFLASEIPPTKGLRMPAEESGLFVK